MSECGEREHTARVQNHKRHWFQESMVSLKPKLQRRNTECVKWLVTSDKEDLYNKFQTSQECGKKGNQGMKNRWF